MDQIAKYIYSDPFYTPTVIKVEGIFNHFLSIEASYGAASGLLWSIFIVWLSWIWNDEI